MSVPTKTRVFVLNNPPKTEILPDTFKIEERDIPELRDGEVLIKPIAYDNMPALRGWIGASADPKRLYAPPITKGQVIRTPAISEVIESKSSKWQKGQRVTGMPGWVEYAVVKESEITGEAAKIKGQSEWISIGGLGVTGLTAWAGAFDVIPNLNKDQVVVVSGAAGGVGTAFVQIAKHVVGCKKVIGIAGGKEKCEYVKSLGADECIDYKSESFSKDLKAAVPDFVNVFFDNVGGAVLNEVLGVMARFGDVAVCGAIDGYNGKAPQLPNWFEVISQRLNIKGFILSDHVQKFGQARQEMEQWVNEGKLTFDDRETVIDTKFEDVPQVWQKLFDGSNTGKLITKLNGQ